MTQATPEVDERGPVDWIVVEFPGSTFNGEIAPALHSLVERDIVRVLDLLIMKKDDDGALEAFEIADLDDTELGEFRAFEDQLAHLLSEEDVENLANAMYQKLGVSSRVDAVQRLDELGLLDH